MCKYVFSFAMVWLLFSCRNEMNKDHALNEFEIEEGFQIELVAGEPLISDPVDMEIDELGRWYVVEMHGYPLDLSGSGVIKRLIDTNSDGIPDQSTVLIDGLVLPTGILRWKQGFLVTDPPHVLYIEDSDNDGKAETRDTILSGFARSNPQHNVNNPTLGLDNWIYLSHEGAVKTQSFADILGDQGSAVHFPGFPEIEGLAKNANGLGVRFKLNPPQIEMLSVRCQFGQTFSPWGHHFQTNNATHLFHAVINSHYMNRNQSLLIPSGQQYIPKSGRGFEIYPITVSPEHQLLTDIGAMTSACGIQWYQGGIFPEAYNHCIFTAEPVHNLVHVDTIRDKGATFESIELHHGHEFLASYDSWFRPVNHYIGPDGALYILDYHRKIIEHPEWLSEEVIESGDLELGRDKGRIYRITPVGTPSMRFLDTKTLVDLEPDQMIQLLGHKNIWWRTHAQRLLMDDQDPALISKLRSYLLTSGSALGKIHGMWNIQDKNGMDPKTLITLLNDASAGVRENAVKIAEFQLSSEQEIKEELLTMANDPSAKVRFQVLLTLGEITDPEVRETRFELLKRDIEDPWVHIAALSARDLDLIQLYMASAQEFEETETTGTRAYFKRLSETLVGSVDSETLNQFLKGMLVSSRHPWFEPLVLQGINQAVKQHRELSIDTQNLRLLAANFTEDTEPALRTACLQLINSGGYFRQQNNPLLARATATLNGNASDGSFIQDAIRIVGWTDADQHLKLLSSTRQDNPSLEIRLTLLDALEHVKTSEGLQFLISIWPSMVPDERAKGLQILLKGDSNRLALLNAIKNNQIHASSLSWSNTVSLLNSSNQTIRKIARNLLQGNDLDADAVWKEYSRSLTLPMDANKGQIAFKKSCSTCHQIRGKNGIAFGPDLSAVKNRNKASILLDILQPNKSIADGYELWTLETRTGLIYSGIISQQSPITITVRDASGKEETLDRAQLLSSKVSEVSAMPENLHAQLSLQEMADLLAYIKDPGH